MADETEGVMAEEDVSEAIAAGESQPWLDMITEAEKVLRRTTVLKKRQQSGKKCRPLRPRQRGWTGPYREFKVVEFHDETGKFTHQILSADRRTVTGIHINADHHRVIPFIMLLQSSRIFE